MNPLMFFRSAPYLVIAVLLALLGWTTHLYLGKRDQLAALTASVQALGQAAEKAVEEKKAEYATNLATVKADHERRTESIRANAVRAYLAAHGGMLYSSGGGSVRPVTGSQPVHDGAEQKPVLDESTIENCADDANKIDAWQQWCGLNHCPVKE